MIRSASGERIGSSWNDEVIPQQLHVSRLPQGISLGPGQAAIVPVSFLPRYPDIDNGDDHNAVLNRPPPFSSIAEVDLGDLVGENVMDRINSKAYNKLLGHASNERRRSNLGAVLLPPGDEYEVKTTIVIDTTRGMMELPISASSVRENSFSAPDTIHFHHPEYESKLNVDDRVHKRTTPPLGNRPTPAAILLDTVNFNVVGENDDTSIPEPPEPPRDCYDVFLSNPSPTEELEIAEVLISSPELISVEFDPQRLLMSPDLVVFPTEPSQAIRQWTQEGPMYLPPDSVDNYIATVCTAMNGDAQHSDENSGIHLEEMGIRIEESATPERSLGFLQVTTSEETLFIGLERMPDERISIQDPTPALNAVPQKSESESTSLLQATPEEIDFHFMSSQSPTMSTKVDLQNKSPAPIRIMRMTTGLNIDSPGVMGRAALIGLQVNASFVVTGPSSAPVILDPTDDKSGTVIISATMERPIAGLPIHSLHFTGALFIRGTMDTNHSFERWRHELSQDPHHDTHLVLEIPFSVSLLNGRIDVMIERSTHPYPQIFSAQPWDKSGRIISALFFPLSRLKALEGSENPLPTQSYQDAEEIGHDLLVVSNNKAISLSLEGAEVVAEEGDVHGESLCDRFNVSITSPFETSSERVDDLIGYLSIHYKFNKEKGVERRRKMRDREETDHIHATKCYLNIITSPIDAGMHRVPLIIFPGHLEVSTPNSVPEDSLGFNELDNPETENGPEATGMSFLRMLSWLRSSVAGRSLLEVVGSIGEEKGSKSFRRFLRTICRHSDAFDDSKLKPILLKMGAIEHSEIVRTPLFLTNHNPVPITVQVDVGEVEGMSITVGRDASQGAGDGNNMLDYFPKSLGLKQVIKSGRHQGQPLDGLRQFLLSNDKALSFSARFPFRDAVSLNMAAVARQPLLKPLFKLYSYAKFHREQLPDRTKSFATTCESLPYPPLYRSFESETPEQYGTESQGPIIVSGDKTLSRPLQVCRGKDTSDASDSSSVLIPPGATARFEVRVRAPPAEYLNNDISQVIATGLVLSTNFGHLMPIFAAFEALQGQLHVSHVGTDLPWNGKEPGLSTTAKEEDVNVIVIPLGLYWKSPDTEDGTTTAPLSIPPGDAGLQQRSAPELIRNSTAAHSNNGISLHLTSTFSREVRLLKVESCNPWFRVVLLDKGEESESHADLGTNVGHLYSTVSCSANSDIDVRYPSYYQCALNWLTDRSDLQPPGCGRVPALQKRKPDDEGGVDATHRGVGRVKVAFERVLSLLEEAYSDEKRSNNTAILLQELFDPRKSPIAIKSGRRRSNGIVPLPLLNSFAEAWDAWKEATAFGLGSLSSNLRAKIEYETFSGERNTQTSGANRQSLSLSMHNLAVESVIAAPKLFHSRSVSGVPQLGFGTETPSVVEFSPTLVGSTALAKISLRNPTAVPVRVRLAASPSLRKPERNIEHSADDWTRNRFLRNLGSPYVQNDFFDSGDNGSHNNLWWNGGGAFYMGDGRGDFIRSNHNITIKAGAGAHVSLVNPSLHANSAFVVGCGIRCGIRAGNLKKSKQYSGPELCSPIGAAAASGITLLGRKRFPLPQTNAMATEEPNVLAGGIAGDSGPPAFALPYSSLDEIVIPPYGEAEIGPVYFRPPGRFAVLGCGLASESEATHTGQQTAALCKDQVFESMIFLENSLTGLERLVLRGKSLNEQLYILDPPPAEGEDSFGDIEFRSGRSTLVFPGTSEGQSSHHGKVGLGSRSVTKEVLVHNGGDIAVNVEVIYLADNSKVLDKKWPSRGVASSACTFGSFRLFDCSESPHFNLADDEASFENIHAGFELSPGENRSLFIEHVPDCTKQEEFISLNIEYTHGKSPSIARPNETGRTRLKKRNRSQRKKIDLAIGYKMSAAELAGCLPVDGASNSVVRPIRVTSSHVNTTDSVVGTKAFHEFKFRGEKTSGIASGYEGKFARLCDCFVLLAAFALLAFSWTTMPQAIESVWQKFRFSTGASDKAKPTASKSLPTMNSRWFPLFRCLARADPTAAELQALGREQIRQVVISRYRSKGIVPPQSLNNPGFLSRERTSKGANASGHRAGKESVAGNERARTLSDALFQNVSGEENSSSRVLLPLGLGWRSGFSRGIIAESSIGDNALYLKTRNLILARRRTNESELEMERSIKTDDYQDSDAGEESYEGEVESGISAEEGTLGDDATDDSTLDMSVSEQYAAEAHLSIDGGSEESHALTDSSTGQSLTLKEVSDDESKADQGKKQKKNEPRMLRQDAKTNKPKSKQNSEASSSHDGVISGPESWEPDSGVRRAARTDQQRLSKGGKITNTTNGKKSPIPTSGEGTAKRNGHKFDSKDSNLKTSSEPGSSIMPDGRKQGGSAVQQTSHKAKEIGKSENQQKRGTRALQKAAASGSNNLRPEKGSKSERVKGPTKKANSEISSKKKGKGKSKNQSQPKSRTPSPATTTQPELSGVGVVKPENVAEKSSASEFRPPPGLAPPPGFLAEAPQGETSLATASTSAAELGPMLSSLLPHHEVGVAGSSQSAALSFLQQTSGGNDLLFNGHDPSVVNNAESAFPVHGSRNDSMLGKPSGPSQPQSGGFDKLSASMNPSSFQSQNDGFDVMDFLDSILNETAQEQAAPTHDTDGGLLTGSSPILSNPWASEGQSRAAAYGISFEKPETLYSAAAEPTIQNLGMAIPVEDQVLAGTLPLLTPAAILFSDQEQQREIERTDDEDGLVQSWMVTD